MYVYEQKYQGFIKKPDAELMNATPEEYFSGPYIIRWKHFATEKDACKWIAEQMGKK